jgi:hypothetical protein
MSIFGSILSAIFSHDTASVTPPVGSTAETITAHPPVDVQAVLGDMAARRGDKLNWKVSIVDLMTLLGLDSSLYARRTLAGELHYTGDTNDSAAMNIWLHKQVMLKLAENGGVLPADLRS